MALINVVLSTFFLLRVKKNYPDLWVKLGKPKFITLEGDPRSVSSISMIKFFYFNDLKNEISDKNILFLNKINRYYSVLLIIFFLALMICGIKLDIFQ